MPIWVNNLEASQVRRNVFETLSQIQTSNRPANSQVNYGTDIQLVTDSWPEEGGLDTLPAIAFRFDRTEYHDRESFTLNATARFLSRLFVAGTPEEGFAKLDILRDDVIACLYAGYRSDGYSYSYNLLEDIEHPPTEQGELQLTMVWALHYTRSQRLERRP